MTAAENVGAGHPSIEAALESWWKSTGHRENMLMPGATRIGVAEVDAPGRRYGSYWALELAAL